MQEKLQAPAWLISTILAEINHLGGGVGMSRQEPVRLRFPGAVKSASHWANQTAKEVIL
jgi:hypothetical protein